MVAVHKLLLCTGLQPDFVLQDKITIHMVYNYHNIGMDSDRNVYTAVQYCSLLTDITCIMHVVVTEFKGKGAFEETESKLEV